MNKKPKSVINGIILSLMVSLNMLLYSTHTISQNMALVIGLIIMLLMMANLLWSQHGSR